MTRTSRCTSIHRGRGADEDRMSRSGGFSRIRLGRMHDVMARHVAQGEAPGIVTALRRHGEGHVDAIGTKAVGGAVPAHRAITLRDLLTFRLGLGIIMEPSADYPIQKALNELQVVGFGPPNVAAPYDPDEWMRRLGTLPLMHQPGEKWMYNTGSYVLGVLIARAAGQPLEAFFREDRKSTRLNSS